ncbi:hypothetical protein [Massilia eburnea]|uniref:hypothetical protein n=1 Tax=Massilia eburnea TaxID=1776165 RepID=UPI003D6A3043
MIMRFLVTLFALLMLAPAQALTVEEIGGGAERLLKEGRFDELDRLASEYIRQDTRLVAGNSALYHFYDTLGGFKESGNFGFASTIPRARKDELLMRWLEKKPESVAVRLALAEFWTIDAWNTRGEKAASDIPESVWKAFRWRMNQARLFLDQVKSRDDPHFYYLQIDIAKGLDDKAAIDANFEAGRKRFPNYFHYYSQRASLLQEKWFGDPGELQSYVRSLAVKPGGDDGLIAYSYVTWEMMKYMGGKRAMQEVGLQWPAIKAGYAAREKRYGLRNRDWNVLCVMAVTAGDRPAAKTALAQIGTNWTSAAWGNQKEFNKWVDWIQSGDPQPSKQ